MKTPKRIQPLVDDGLIDEVVSQLMSGKEATVYMVRCGNEIRCAKVYKEAIKRSFKKAAQYQEGRKSRNSRRSRAMEKGSSYGREQQENAWQNAEVDALYKCADANIRVPVPYGCFEGVLIMELITDGQGDVAPRLNDIVLSAEQALQDHATMMGYVTRMLCAGIVHGDLSEFNVLQDDHGPVIIDLPQAVDASANNNAKVMLERDVNNMTRYYSQFAPELALTKYAKEMWSLYEKGDLLPDTQLSGEFEEDTSAADVNSVLEEIQAAFEEELERRERISEPEEL
ncbi:MULTISPECIES: PA4780 family RIO1-like protein kinase [unclassified Shewanella]|uniref:PA4780 family RIO1-like protein kinase n=1 Tax=unclassified Shewanella TaxID=196818 RepID=UPI000C8478F9|nr:MULTISPECIES: PA4780 family RIO1-like protein kinase [unclassified Shewanella]MDO6680251.1 PA4780 family RIO1-like protein kinase [Shewanella sp. 4_MG-2023]MDO6775892.1 PA4780 family RIO1-like protein kinase [Shewanella sp. 3_MG-2023]PMG29752.1 kinase [Shewanella sp. 10N.286.52.C2]PMG42880.1 kinase [Shewanella sp. 10N.286.52.B9]PMI03452.1 kinase [Shewanella sp. 10N.286.48.A6]